MNSATPHSAEASALGFYYQSFYGLKTLVSQDADAAAVAIERADDVELTIDQQTLLFQLKHSMSAKPGPVTLSSRALWRTFKVWIDLLPELSLADTDFHLVTVGDISAASGLIVLLSPGSDRAALTTALVKEAERVRDEREAAKAQAKALPYADRADGCAAFLQLSPVERLNFLRRVRIEQGSLKIDQMEAAIAAKLTLVKLGDRPIIARSLIEWWDRQVIYALCGGRPRFIARAELLDEIAERIADLEHEHLLPDFEAMTHPDDYQPGGMLTRQISLVGGKGSDLAQAIREEWRARNQRSKWINDKPAMAVKVDRYDQVIREHWSDRHARIVEDCAELDEVDKCASGLALLRWTHDAAPTTIQPIAPGWQAPYYVRGSFQVLAINRKVGWHPEYLDRLADDEA